MYSNLTIQILFTKQREHLKHSSLIFLLTVFNFLDTFVQENIYQDWLFKSSLTTMRVTGQKGFLFPLRKHVKTVVFNPVFTLPLLELCFIPPLSLSNVAGRTIETWDPVTSIFSPVRLLRFKLYHTCVLSPHYYLGFMFIQSFAIIFPCSHSWESFFLLNKA